jgi:hypothetical protein
MLRKGSNHGWREEEEDSTARH